MIYTNINRSAGNKTGGLKQTIYLAPISAFETIQKRTNYGQPSETNVIAAAHTFKAGEGFIKVYSSMDSGKLTTETIGSNGSKSSKKTLAFNYPGTSIEVEAFAEKAINDDWIALTELPDGNLVQLGEEGIAAQISKGFDTGTTASSVNAQSFTVEAYAPGLTFYPFAIDLKP